MVSKKEGGSGHQLDEVGLAPAVRLLKQIAQMCHDRCRCAAAAARPSGSRESKISGAQIVGSDRAVVVDKASPASG